MSQNNFSYPYPVLTCYGDDVAPALIKENVIVGALKKDDNGDSLLPVTLVMDNKDLQKYIEQGLAEYIVEVDCPTTHLRFCFKSQTNTFEIQLPSKGVANKVSFRPLLVAKENFAYTNSGFDEYYADETYDLEVGDVLAIFNPFSYDFDIDYYNLRAYSSIMVFKQADEGQEDITYNTTDSDKIIIYLPRTKLSQYNLFGSAPEYEPAIHASLVQCALVSVLLMENWDITGEEEPLWKRTIRYRVAHEDELKQYKLTEKEDLIKLSQKLLRDPVQRMFDKFNEMIDDDK